MSDIRPPSAQRRGARQFVGPTRSRWQRVGLVVQVAIRPNVQVGEVRTRQPGQSLRLGCTVTTRWRLPNLPRQGVTRQSPTNLSRTPRSETIPRMSVPRARMRTSKRHDDHRGGRRSSTGPGKTSVLVTGHGGRRVVYLVLPRVLAASAGMGGTQLMWVPDVQDGKPWSWRSGEALCPADDIDTTAE